jgi:3',5'-cyclic AMP phosphodiesterase CpdA
MSTLLAHLSDPHILDLRGVPLRRMLLNKRVTGWLNLRLKRGHKHRPSVVEAMMADLRALAPDHVAITGDLTNLALEPEFEAARAMIERLHLHPEQVSVIPGNHDLYTEGARRAGRFGAFFERYITSDLDLGVDLPGGRFPYVRLRGHMALIGLSSAVPRLPLVSSGRLGDAQRRALSAALAHPEVASRVAVVLSHHPVVDPRGGLGPMMRGLDDVRAFREALDHGRDVLALHGHWHRRGHEKIAGARGATVHRLGATSASLVHHDHEKMASYNVYEVDKQRGLVRAYARVWNVDAERFEDAALPDGAGQTG